MAILIVYGQAILSELIFRIIPSGGRWPVSYLRWIFVSGVGNDSREKPCEKSAA